MERHSTLALIFGLVCYGSLGLVDGEYTIDYNGDIMRRLEGLEKRDNDQTESIMRLQNKVIDQSQTITGLEGIVADQSATNTWLQQKVDMQSILIQTQTQENVNLKAFMKQQRNELEELKQLAKYSMMDPKYKTIRNENGTIIHSLSHTERFAALQERQVAFHARIDRREMGPIDIGQTINFDVVMLNIGDGYKPNGVFLAPVGGIYFFSTSISILHAGKEIHVELMKNGKQIAGAYANGANQGSVSAVVQLAPSDAVWVSALNHPDTYLYGGTLSSFTGYRISGYY